MVLTVPGRKSGEPRSTPITPMYVDDKRYVVGGFPGADWVKNARAAGDRDADAGPQDPKRCGWWSCPPTRRRPLLRQFPTWCRRASAS